MSLYDEINKLDKDVATVYQMNIKRIGNDVLDGTAVQQLFGVALGKDWDISPNEVKALVLIRDKAKFSNEANDAWRKALNEGAILQALGKGSGKRLQTDKDLNEVFNAIGLAATSVNFTSPRTMLTYDHRQYLAMKMLIKSGDIQVWDLQGVQLLKNRNDLAGYVARLNCLFLFSAAGRQLMIIHELAHAIQDWNDLNVDHDEWVEADAYIVQGLVERALKRPVDEKYAFKKPVDMVLAGNAKLNNDDWTKAYDDAAKAVHTDPFFISIYGDKTKRVDNTDEETGTPEKDRLAEVLKILDKAKP